MDTFVLGAQVGSKGSKRVNLGAILGAGWSCLEAVAAAILFRIEICMLFLLERFRVDFA